LFIAKFPNIINFKIIANKKELNSIKNLALYNLAITGRSLI